MECTHRVGRYLNRLVQTHPSDYMLLAESWCQVAGLQQWYLLVEVEEVDYRVADCTTMQYRLPERQTMLTLRSFWLRVVP